MLLPFQGNGIQILPVANLQTANSPPKPDPDPSLPVHPSYLGDSPTSLAEERGEAFAAIRFRRVGTPERTNLSQEALSPCYWLLPTLDREREAP